MGELDELSVIGIGRHANRPLLAQIAGHGGGRVYFVDDPDLLVDVLRAVIE